MSDDYSRGHHGHGGREKFKPNEGDWICADQKCGNVNFARRPECNKCGKSRKEGQVFKKGGTEIGKQLAEKSKGLFSAEDWQCKSCGNVNWARRMTCNMCNAPKYGKVEQRSGFGGGYMERDEVVEYKEREDSDGEYDEFGRKKKNKRFRATGYINERGDNNGASRGDNGAARDSREEEEEEDDEDDGDVSKYKLDSDEEDDEEGGDLSKYMLDSDDDDIVNIKKANNNSSSSNNKKSSSRSPSGGKRKSGGGGQRSSRSRSRSSSRSSSSSSSSSGSSSSSRSRSSSSSRSRSGSRRSRSDSRRRSRSDSRKKNSRSRSRSADRGTKRRGRSRSRSRSRSGSRSHRSYSGSKRSRY